jgi:serine protease Do
MDNRPMLGVSTEKNDKGVAVQSVSKESAAEKAGLKEKDIITKIDDQKISEPDELSEIVQKHKPGDKITITYLRDGKEQKATAELTKWKGTFWSNGDNNFNFDMGNLNMDHIMPKIRAPYAYAWTGNNPKLGLSVQDNEDGKGVKVIEVDDESNAAKAGVKEDDVITEVDGKAINNADDIVKVIRESKDKVSVMMKIQRAGKTQNVEVKMPRKLKSADL